MTLENEVGRVADFQAAKQAAPCTQCIVMNPSWRWCLTGRLTLSVFIDVHSFYFLIWVFKIKRNRAWACELKRHTLLCEYIHSSLQIVCASNDSFNQFDKESTEQLKSFYLVLCVVWQPSVNSDCFLRESHSFMQNTKIFLSLFTACTGLLRNY